MSKVGNLAQAAVKGTVWNYSTFVASKAFTFISTIILARILAPADFGLLSLGLIVINYLDTIGDFGLGAALIYRQGDEKRTANVAFIITSGMSVVLTALAILLAPWIAVFFNEPRVTPVIQVLAISFIISGLGSIHASLLRKNLDFRRRFIPGIGRAITKGAVSITLALMGLGVWSLVWGQVAGELVSTILFWWLSSWRPKFEFDLGVARALTSYGLQMTLVGLFGMINNIDYLVVGYRMDTTQLGYYTIAFRLPELIIINICYVVGQVLFPTYSKLQHDLAAMRSGFLTAMRYLSFITVPAGIGMFITAPDFVHVFYTDRWSAAIPVMQVLAIYAVVYSLSFNAGDIYKATGRPGLLNQINVVKILLTVPILWIAAGYSIFHVALGQVMLTIALTLLELGIVSHVINIKPRQMIEAIKPAAIGALVMLLGTLGLQALMAETAPIIRLLALILSGGLLYVAALWFVGREQVHQARMLLGPMIKNVYGKRKGQETLVSSTGLNK